MAAVEPYAPCPCGSGEKFKWCCQKVEPFADRAQRLFDSGQGESAIKVLDEGLRKEAGNPWLLTRKAVMQIRQGEAEPAKATLRQVLARNPKHIGALVLLTRCVLETEGPVNGAGMFQEVLGKVDEAQRPGLGSLARVVAYMLAQARLYPATLKHLRLGADLGDPDGTAESSIRNVEASPTISPWLKDDYRLAPAPGTHWGETRKRFDDAVARAGRGLWASAAAAFDLLSASEPGGEADYNLGLCRLWIGDQAGALGPLRRRSKALGSTAEAVDLEVLCQQIEPIHPEDRVEMVQLAWPLRHRDALLSSLRAAPDIFDDGTEPVEEDNPEAGEISSFILLDRPRVDRAADAPLAPDQVPRIVGRVSVADDSAVLETYDDGRVDTLGDRFTALAGQAIAPAHPETTVLGVEARSTLAMAWEWLTPEGMTAAEADRLTSEKQAQILREVWPETPMPYLNFRTPAQAARDGNAEVPLRAALLQHEQGYGRHEPRPDFAPIRERLGIPPEPTIDPETVDVASLPLARLGSLAPGRLDDRKLVLYLQRARRAMLVEAIEAAALAIVARPALFEGGLVDHVSIHADLASFADGRGDREEAQSWIDRGRQADSPAQRGQNAPLWDMIEVRLRARTDAPEAWVPELAVIMERYSHDPTANQVILLNLVEMGLVRMQPNPDSREDILLDSRPLQALLAEYGPRVTTSSGRLGVSATRPEVWTPGGPASGSGGGLWTPGAGAGPATGGGDKPKLIIPGR